MCCLAFAPISFLSSPPASAGSFWEQFFDMEGGQLDMSDWLLERQGFLPVPIIVTEPAVGYGGGLALLFFHASKPRADQSDPNRTRESTDRKAGPGPPGISGIGGFATENGTWGAGAFHFGSWRQDRIRYLGALLRPSLNLTFYGGADSPLFKGGLDYNLEGWFLLQELAFRISKTDLFFGGRLTYFDSKSTFDIGVPIPGIEKWESDFDNLGLGLFLKYDSRDNIFTPTRGIDAEISTTNYSGSGLLSRDREYQITGFKSHAYWPIHPRIVLGWRIMGELSSGSVPFYALPYLDMRGIPAMRYQGEDVLLTEIETRWKVSDRWSLLGFGGVGRAAGKFTELDNAENRWAGGTGFRYLLVQKLGLNVGIDIARGPEDWAFYIQVGSAWKR